jgi:hypothetical protein
MATCPGQGSLSNFPSQDRLSKGRLLVQVKTACPRGGCWSKARLLVQVMAGCPSCPWPVVQVVHGWLSKLSKSWLPAQLVQVTAACPSQWPLVEAKTSRLCCHKYVEGKEFHNDSQMTLKMRCWTVARRRTLEHSDCIPALSANECY